MKTKRIPVTQDRNPFSEYADKSTALLLNIQILDPIFQHHFKYLVTIVFNVL